MPTAEDYGVISHHCCSSGNYRIVRHPKFERMVWIMLEQRHTVLAEISFCPFCGANLENEYNYSLGIFRTQSTDFGYGC